MAEEQIGSVIDSFARPVVAGIELTGTISVGVSDRVRPGDRVYRITD